MNKQQENLEHYIELVESMRMPEPLTAWFSLDSEEQSNVGRCVEDVRDKGFAILSNFLGVERLEQMRVGLEPIFALTGNRIVDETKRGWPGTQTVHIPNLYAKTRSIDEVSIDPVLLSIVEGVLGSLFRCLSPSLCAQDQAVIDKVCIRTIVTILFQDPTLRWWQTRL